MGTEIEPVLTAQDRKKFINFPHDLYAGDPNYVPELKPQKLKTYWIQKKSIF